MKAVILLLPDRSGNADEHRPNSQYAAPAPLPEGLPAGLAGAAIWLPDDWRDNPMVRVSQGAGLLGYLAEAKAPAEIMQGKKGKGR